MRYSPGPGRKAVRNGKRAGKEKIEKVIQISTE